MDWAFRPNVQVSGNYYYTNRSVYWTNWGTEKLRAEIKYRRGIVHRLGII